MGSVVKSEAPASETNAAANGGATARQNHAEVHEFKVDGVGAVGVSSPHIIQYPRQPKRDDGKWVAIGSLLGALLGKVVSSSIMDKVKDAENKWREINDKLARKGDDVLGKSDPEWQKMLDPENDLDNLGDDSVNRRDEEYNYADALAPCNDEIHQKLCAYVNCGYKPDYKGIATRAISTAQAAVAKEKRELMRGLNRYATKQCCDVHVKLATASVMAVVGNVSKLREQERQKMWEINSELFFKGAELFEKHRDSRIRTGMEHEKTAIGIKTNLYQWRNKNYFDLVRLGGEILTAAGRNYGWLAASLRQSAEKDTSGLASLGALIAVVAGIFFCGSGGFCGDDACDGGGTQTTATGQTEVRHEGGHMSATG